MSHYDDMRSAAPWPGFFDVVLAASLGAAAGAFVSIGISPGPASAPCLWPALVGTLEGILMGKTQLRQATSDGATKRIALSVRIHVLASLACAAILFAWLEPVLLGLLHINAPVTLRAVLAAAICAVLANQASPFVFVVAPNASSMPTGGSFPSRGR